MVTCSLKNLVNHTSQFHSQMAAAATSSNPHITQTVAHSIQAYVHIYGYEQVNHIFNPLKHPHYYMYHLL